MWPRLQSFTIAFRAEMRPPALISNPAADA